MIDRGVKAVSIATLLMLGLWRPSPSHPLLLDLMVCAAGTLIALTLLFRSQIETRLAEATASQGRSSGGWTS
jgi:hypothetical protein